jgi:hypothetical protein
MFNKGKTNRTLNKVEFWVKSGADKRRATREELLRLMQASKFIFADEIETTGILEDFDIDYFINSPINIFIFNNRLEVTSPGILPNTITEENIKFGVHFERNPTILSFLEKDKKFRYSGRGSGIPRVIKACKNSKIKVEFINDKSKQQFKVVFQRPCV